MVNLTAVALAGTLFSIIDFKGHSLDESFGFEADFNPVVGAVGADPFQQWSFLATSIPSQLIIQNADVQKYLSYAGAPTGSTDFAQTVIDGSNPVTFELLLVNTSPETFNIVDVKSGLALTAWGAVPGQSELPTPVTYEILQAGRAEQVWNISLAT
ncbi:hypothetical protein B0H16DRAFT_1694896 [Mycena metata]|uniref:Uncharacterized protein n=1 Tax=Mycena metata TaxID=1033252 RepID=A0AAD7MYJ5_9AGAR|nr:hypothetical protein B0H16DRAFT_1694896 [Mycena metata]